MYRGGGSGALSGRVTAVAPEDAVDVPSHVDKSSRVEREWFQAHADSEPEERMVVYSATERVLFNGTVEEFEELCRIVAQ